MKLILLSTLILFTMGSVIAVAGQQKMYTSKGYPYKNLIYKVDTVKIIHSTTEQGIRCQVQVNWGNQSVKSKHTLVSNEAFNHEPLASCLSRAEAKDILASAYMTESHGVLAQTNGL